MLGELSCGPRTEKCDLGPDATLFPGRSGAIRRRIDAETGNPALDEVLQQVPIIARDFDDPTFGAEPEALHRVGGKGAKGSMFINGLGAFATGITLLVVLVAKFVEGA